MLVYERYYFRHIVLNSLEIVLSSHQSQRTKEQMVCSLCYLGWENLTKNYAEACAYYGCYKTP